MNAQNTKLERLTANEQWISVAHSLGSLCNGWASRRDLIVYLGRDGGQGVAPAFFDMDLAEIEINSDLAFGTTDPLSVGDLRDRMVLSQYPVAGGLALHESMHARFSTADWALIRTDFTESAWTVFTLLEEMRVESKGVSLYPRDTGYLRTSAKSLVMGEPSKSSPRFSAQVIYGRFVIGVLTAEDVAAVRSWLLSNGWTVEDLENVERITEEFASLEDSGPGLVRQIALAKELDKLMPEDPAGSDSSEGNGNLSDSGELFDAVMESLGRAERGGRADAFEAAETIAAEIQADIEEMNRKTQEQNKVVAQDVFFTGGSFNSMPAQLSMSRLPTSDERAAGVMLSQSLLAARYRDRAVLEYRADTPPGRLHGGEAMRLAAARWAGAPTNGYLPFKRRKRMETDEPNLTVGIMCDTSGSMESIQPAVGSATWIISDAVNRIDKAKAAQVYFGRDVHPGLRTGERLREVRTWRGGGAYEDFDRGFRSLDGELELLNGSGARLLFVVSDGQFKTGPGINQVGATKKWLEECTANGVAVVWLQLKGQRYKADIPGVEVVEVDPMDILSATREIGQACIRTLANVSGTSSGGW